ncbi:hypothetical protein M378DRAFT_172466, partial [Amanita muscaria Koide BX008]
MTYFRLLCSLLGRVHSFYWITSENAKLSCHLNGLDVDLAASPGSYRCSLTTLFRVWDVFVVDGLDHDVLFRVAFGILGSNEQELLRCESIPALYVAENLPTRMWGADRILQVGVFRFLC